jgi:polysaccharide export outer membrane protein
MSLFLLCTSCVTYNKVRYFNELTEPAQPNREQKKIMPFDNLFIRVLSIDEQTNTLFDVNAGNAGLQFVVGFLVDENGNIDFPFVGSVNVAGLTLSQASLKLQESLSDYVPKASIVIRFIDNKVTIMGQVEHEGVFPINGDNISIYEALSLGGGISQYGNLKKVVLIRQESGKVTQCRLDLSNSDIINSKYYYIKPNDIIVVEPLRSITWNYNNLTLPTLLAAITTFLAMYVVLFPNNN